MVDKAKANYSLLIKYFFRPFFISASATFLRTTLCRANIYLSDLFLSFQVISVDDIPPPIIQIGPSNQTLPKGSVAMVTCRAGGTPQPEIKWTKDGANLQNKSRFVIVQSGTLKIDGEIFFSFCLQIAEGRASWPWFHPLSLFLGLFQPDRSNCEFD